MNNDDSPPLTYHPSRVTPTERLHIAFINSLGYGKLATYTDGGGTNRRRGKRRAAGRAAKQARKRQRGR